jgi:alanine racemase
MAEATAWGRAGALLTVDLAAIRHNWRLLALRVVPAECAAVVKADAYGLGLAPVARALWQAGARTFFVALPEEGLALRTLLPDARIGVLNGLLPGYEADYARARLLPALSQLGEIAAWASLARTLGRRLPAFVHLDSGLNRLGVPFDEQERLFAEPARLHGIAIEGWLSHLACAEEAGHPKNAEQRARFRAALARLPPAPASLVNSSGIFLDPEHRFDLARPGAALYGINPTAGRSNPMRAVVTLEARILQVRHVDSPMTVGYGAAHRATGPARVATVAIGYADGYGRSLGGRGMVGIAGREAPVIGRISMDLTTIDVTDIPDELARAGAVAEIIGPVVPVDRVADAAGTIGYEILTALGRRFARRHVGGAA